MNFEDFDFIELITGSIKQTRNQVCSISQFLQTAKDLQLGKNPRVTNYYRSVFRYGRDFLQHTQKTGSTANFKGRLFLDYAPIDIDADTMEKSHDKLVKVLKHLQDTWYLTPEILDIDFSGRKGFHLLIPAGLFRPEPAYHLNKITKAFVRRLFPDGWMNDDENGGLVDPKLYAVNQIFRLRGSFNLPEDESSPHGFKNRLNGSTQAVLEDYKKVFELWKEPNEDGLSEEFLTGDYYWKFPEDKRLSGLWQEVAKQVIDEEEGQSLTSSGKARSGTAAQQRALTAVPPCIKNLLAGFENGKISRANHNRNDSLCAAALFFIHSGYPDAAVRGACHGLNKALGKDAQDDYSVNATLNSMLERQYPLGCGYADGKWGLHNWCADGNIENCPERQRSTVTKSESSFINIKTATDRLWTRLKAGPSAYSFGVREIDQISGNIDPGRFIVCQAAPSVGKTLFSMRLLRHFTAIAKERNEIVLFMSPELTEDESAEFLLYGLENATRKKLYEKAGNGGLSKTSLDWIENYQTTLAVKFTPGFSAKGINEYIALLEKDWQKKVAVLFYDGATFVQKENNFARSDEQMVTDLWELTTKGRRIGFYNVHLPKAEMQQGKDGGRPRSVHEMKEIRPSPHAAHGSAFYFDLARYLFSLWREKKTGCLMVGLDKMKDRNDGQFDNEIPEAVRFLNDHCFNLYTVDEAMELIDRGELSAGNLNCDPVIFLNDAEIKKMIRAL